MSRSDKRVDMMPLWTDAYMADTTHLETEHHGAYLLLLMKAWRMGTADLPDDDMFLRNTLSYTPKKWRAIRPIIEPFFTIENGRWKHKRLSAEWAKANRLSARKATPKGENGSPGGQGMIVEKVNESNDGENPYAGAEAGAGAGAVGESVSTPPSIIQESLSTETAVQRRQRENRFAEFWEGYGSPVDQLPDACETHWVSLPDLDRDAALAALASRSKPPSIYPLNWLRQRSWEGGTAPLGKSAAPLATKAELDAYTNALWGADQ